MNINIEAYKPNKTIEVQAQSINSTTDLRNAIYIQTNEKTNEDRYLQEKEFKLRQEFNDFIYVGLCNNRDISKFDMTIYNLYILKIFHVVKKHPKLNTTYLCLIQMYNPSLVTCLANLHQLQ